MPNNRNWLKRTNNNTFRIGSELKIVQELYPHNYESKPNILSNQSG